LVGLLKWLNIVDVEWTETGFISSVE